MSEPLYITGRVSTFEATGESIEISGTIARMVNWGSRNWRGWIMHGTTSDGTPVQIRERWSARRPRRLDRRAKKRRS